MNKLALLFLLAIGPNSHASNLSLNFGVEPVKKSGSFSDVLTLQASYDAAMTAQNLRWRFETGYWNDKRPGGENSFFLGPSLGLEITPWIFYVEIYAGVVYISDRDIFLGGPWQFKETVFFGLAEFKASIGLTLSHISSAGIYKPNAGRNFLMLTAKYQL